MVNCSYDTDNIVPLIVMSGGMIASLIAMIAIITHRKIAGSLCGILISYLVANLLGASAFFYDIVTYACQYHGKALSFIFKVSMVLSLAHLLLLLLHYHIASSTKRTTKIKDFVGLILTAWISSATIGCLNGALNQSVSKILIIVIFILILLSIIKIFHLIARQQQQQRENNRIKRKLFLQKEPEEDEEDPLEEDDFAKPPIKQWNLKLVGCICLSTIVSSIPWLIINVVGLDPSKRHLEHAMPLSIYVLGFYVVAGVCIYIRYRDYKYGEQDREGAGDVSFPTPVVETKRPVAVVRKNSREDLVSNMEQEGSYGTFGL